MSNPTPTNPATDPSANPTPPAGGNGGTTDPTPESGRTFTQAELEAVIKDRLERQQRAIDAKTSKDREAAEAAKLAEQGEFKKLAEQAQRERDEYKARLTEREHLDLAREVAAAAKLPEGMATRLVGATREELEADAAALAKVVAQPAPAPTPGNRPNPRPQAGPDGSATERALVASGKYAAL